MPLEKLKTLGRAAKFDTCGLPSSIESSLTERMRAPIDTSVIYPSLLSSGRCVNLFKVLQSNICERNCFYCANRRDRDCEHRSLSAYELARTFMNYYQRGYVEGLFLSSAIYKGANRTTEEMLKTVQLLRYKYRYRGYVHFVILPGTEASLIEEAAKVADRLSINLEAPSPERLANITASKDFSGELLKPLETIARIDKAKSLRSGITTQFVVGASGESDKEILNIVSRLYQRYRLWRAYYSGFRPVEDTPLEEKPPCPPLREIRLYQSDFLLRRYRFESSELIFDKDGNLPQDRDPKLAWAQSNPDKFPIEINKADFWQLMRAPGIGRITAKRILSIRRKEKIRTLDQLKRLKIVIRRARNFLTLDGKFFPLKEPAPSTTLNKQLFFWEEL